MLEEALNEFLVEVGKAQEALNVFTGLDHGSVKDGSDLLHIHLSSLSYDDQV